MANKFTLKGHDVEVGYEIGANPSFTALTLTEGGTVRTYKPAEITTDETAVGTLVSVPVLRSIDTGGTRFGFLLPAVQVALGKSVPVTTVGVTESFTGPDSVPHRPTTWHCVALHGTASEVIVPLAEGVAGN